MSFEIVGLGETLGLVTLEGTGRLRSGAGARIAFGGAETNTLVGAARLGIPGTWLGAVGCDSVGQMILAGLRAEGVGVAHVLSSRRAPTALMIKYRRTAESMRVEYFRHGSAFSRLQPDDVPTDAVREARVLHTSGITAGLGEGPLAVVRHAVTTARDAGTLVSFDVNHRRRVWGERDPRPVLRELVGAADITFASIEEAQLLLGEAVEDPAEAAREMAALGPSWVVIKQGAEGLTASVDGELHRVAARRCVVCDTVGAGDALAAGVLVGRLRAMSVTDTLQLGVDLGSYAVTVDGDFEGAATWEDLAEFRAASGDVAR